MHRTSGRCAGPAVDRAVRTGLVTPSGRSAACGTPSGRLVTEAGIFHTTQCRLSSVVREGARLPGRHVDLKLTVVAGAFVHVSARRNLIAGLSVFDQNLSAIRKCSARQRHQKPTTTTTTAHDRQRTAAAATRGCAALTRSAAAACCRVLCSSSDRHQRNHHYREKCPSPPSGVVHVVFLQQRVIIATDPPVSGADSDRDRAQSDSPRRLDATSITGADTRTSDRHLLSRYIRRR